MSDVVDVDTWTTVRLTTLQKHTMMSFGTGTKLKRMLYVKGALVASDTRYNACDYLA